MHQEHLIVWDERNKNLRRNCLKFIYKVWLCLAQRVFFPKVEVLYHAQCTSRAFVSLWLWFPNFSPYYPVLLYHFILSRRPNFSEMVCPQFLSLSEKFDEEPVKNCLKFCCRQSIFNLTVNLNQDEVHICFSSLNFHNLDTFSTCQMAIWYLASVVSLNIF